MAKKKSKEASKVNLAGKSGHPIQYAFRLLKLLNVVSEPHQLKSKFTVNGNRISIAVPEIKFAVAFEGDDYEYFKNNGWHVQKLAYGDIEPFSRVFYALQAGHTARMYSQADPNVKSTSKPEEKILSEIYQRMLPPPDRNYKFTREDGTELTTPDFTWPDSKVAFFMDGSYWHSIKDDKEILKEIKKGDSVDDFIVNSRKDKVRKDGAIRTELGSRGWIVLTCTDEDTETPEGVELIVDTIEKTLRRIKDINLVISDDSLHQESEEKPSKGNAYSSDADVKNDDSENDECRENAKEGLDKGSLYESMMSELES